jgi:hypothetical protein
MHTSAYVHAYTYIKYILTLYRHIHVYVFIIRYQYVQKKKDGRCVWHALESREIRTGGRGLG